MTVQTLALILVAVTMSAGAQILFKLGLSSNGSAGSGVSPGLIATLLTPGVLLGLTLYGVGTLVWLTALNRVEVSQAYPFVGLGFVLTAVFGHFLFGDQISIQRAVGIFLVIAGIVVVARS